MESSGEMRSSAQTNLNRVARRVALTTGVFAGLVGLSALAGWFLGIELLVNWARLGPSQMANNAIAMLLVSVSLLMLCRRENAQPVGALVWAARLLALAAVLIGAATFFEHVTGIDLGIDTLLVRDAFTGANARHPGRMGIISAVLFMILGSGLVLVTSGSTKARRSAHYLGVLVMFLAGLPLMGYLYGTDFLYTIPHLTGIAVQTAVALLLLGAGLIALVPEWGLAAMMGRADAGGVLMRRMLLPVVLVPILLGYLRLMAQNTRLFDIEFVSAAVVLLLIALLTTLVMVSARRVSEAAEQSQRLQLVANSIPQLAWMARGNGLGFWHNQRWYDYTGLTPEQAQGLGWSTIVLDPGELPRVMARWKEAIAAGQPWEDTYRMRRHDGEFRWQLSRAVPMKDASGRVSIWFGTNTDITEQLEARDALLRAKDSAEEANRAKDQFLASLSHELRTPLTPVLATLSSWELRTDVPQELREEMQVMRRNLDLEARLIDDMLDLTRIAKGKISLTMEVLDVHRLLEAILGMYSSEIKGKRLTTHLDLNANRHLVMADAGRLQQVIWNLLKNSVKFTPEGGRIDISTRETDDRLEIAVVDTGIGIAPDLMAKIFTPFSQGNAENVRQYGGLGLGLAIVRALVEAQGGQVTATSEGPGQGARFAVLLPLASEQESHAASQPQQKEAAMVGGQRILLVEDHLDTARALAKILQRAGHEVTLAHCVADAIHALARNPIDLIVSDIGLPDGTGIEFMREVRARGMEAPAIALTGYGMEDDVSRCHEAGFNAHLTKPVSIQRLEEMIATVESARHSEASI